ncbi:MAG: DUF3891 family protein [Chloroflexota bacterium]
MIVREMPSGQLLCIHQTSHGLMAAEFCRHWGNDDFRPPSPYPETLLGIAQHDNGWYEWELKPKLRSDGYPMDFLHDPDVLGKINIWRLSVDRAYTQHPYAGILTGQHAVDLYQTYPIPSITESEQAHIAEFAAEQQMLLSLVQDCMNMDTRISARLHQSAIDSNMRLLQFGDQASLRVTMPWEGMGAIQNCPVDGEGTFTEIKMTFNEESIAFEPWPFGVPEFDVHIHGRMLSQRTFEDEERYHSALSEAPLYSHQWRVVAG